MRIATYNQQCGWDGQCLRSWALLYWHYLCRNPKAIESGGCVQKTVETLVEISPDVIAIQEIFGMEQVHKLKQGLREKGYQYFSVGSGRTFSDKYPIHTLIASRHLAEHIVIPQTGVFGDGHEGGFAGLRLVENDISFMTLHLPFSQPKRLQALEQKIRSVFENMRNDTPQVVLGDFNTSHKEIVKHSRFFDGWEKISPHEKTCSTTPWIRHIFGSDLDHVLAKGVRSKNSGVLHTHSDHKLVWVDLDM